MTSTRYRDISRLVDGYYTGKLLEHGPVFRGADWNSAESQQIAFAQLAKIFEGHRGPFTLIDFGCGYGAFATYLLERGFDFRYTGFDLSDAMIGHANVLHAGNAALTFTTDATGLSRADYVVASGLFSVRLTVGSDDWKAYILETLDVIAALGRHGFAFNMLTDQVDFERPDLYYADPAFFFERCRRAYSRHVALLHDYPRWEFTILVRYEPER